MRVQKETNFNRQGKYFLREDFKGKAAVRMKIFRKKIRPVKILRYSSVSILRAAFYEIHANQTGVNLSHFTLGCSFGGLGEYSCRENSLKPELLKHMRVILLHFKIQMDYFHR